MSPKPPSGSPSFHRIAELDALRGIAAVSVLLYHYTSIYPRMIGAPFTGIPAIGVGYYGVELFFIISGFMIFFTVSRAASLRDFAVSRFARLYPAYWTGMLVTSATLLLDPLNASGGPSLQHFLVNLTMLQTYLDVPNLDPAYWTLAYELAFYVLIAGATFTAARLRVRVEWFCLAWLAIALSVRLLHIPVPWRLGVGTMLHFGQFFIDGIGLYIVFFGRPTRATWVMLVWALLMPALGADPSTPPNGATAYLPMTLVCAALVFVAIRFKPAILRNGVLLFLGRISYPLYLVHSSLGFSLISNLRRVIGEVGALVAATLIAIGIATLVHYLVEVPAQRALRRLLSRPRSAAPIAPVAASS